MTELKTLKDIESRTELDLAIASDMPIKQRPTYHQLLIYNLRQEAILWEKEAQYRKEKYIEYKESAMYWQGRIDFIKQFFNLTDKELKAEVKE